MTTIKTSNNTYILTASYTSSKSGLIKKGSQYIETHLYTKNEITTLCPLFKLEIPYENEIEVKKY